jgi:hypothetical protein
LEEVSSKEETERWEVTEHMKPEITEETTNRRPHKEQMKLDSFVHYDNRFMFDAVEKSDEEPISSRKRETSGPPIEGGEERNPPPFLREKIFAGIKRPRRRSDENSKKKNVLRFGQNSTLSHELIVDRAKSSFFMRPHLILRYTVQRCNPDWKSLCAASV